MTDPAYIEALPPACRPSINGPIVSFPPSIGTRVAKTSISNELPLNRHDYTPGAYHAGSNL